MAGKAAERIKYYKIGRAGYRKRKQKSHRTGWPLFQRFR